MNFFHIPLFYYLMFATVDYLNSVVSSCFVYLLHKTTTNYLQQAPKAKVSLDNAEHTLLSKFP